MITCLFASSILSQDYRRWEPENGVAVRQGLHPNWDSWDKSTAYQTEGETAGDVAVVWSDARSGDQGIYMQVIMPDGEFKFEENGITISDEPGPESLPQVMASDNGSWIIAWQYAPRLHHQGIHRDDPPHYESIFCMKVNANGELLWEGQQYGVLVCDIDDNWIEGVKLFTDDAGGCYITWVGKYSSETFVVRVNSQGEIPEPWEVNGVPMGMFMWTKNYTFPDNDGGLLYVTMDRRAALVLKRISPEGEYPWGEDGIQIGQVDDYPTIRLCSDGGDGYFLAIIENHSNLISINRLSLDGEFHWEQPGEIEANSLRDIIVSEPGSAIVCFTNSRIIRASKISGEEEMVMDWEDNRGVPIVEDSWDVKLSSDGQSGILSGFVRDDGEDNQDLNYSVQKVNSEGETPWGENGILIYDPVWNHTPGIGVVPNGQNTLSLWNTSLDPGKINCQRIDERGEFTYPEEGIAIISGIGGSAKTPILLSNGNSEFALVWYDERSIRGAPHIQFLRNNGESAQPLLEENGMPVIEADYESFSARLIDAVMLEDGAVTVVYNWNRRVAETVLTLQKINSRGQKLWGENGIVMTDEETFVPECVLSAAVENGVYVAWEGHRNNMPDRILLQRIGADGNTVWDAPLPICESLRSLTIHEVISNNEEVFVLWTNSEINRLSITCIDDNGEFVWEEQSISVFEGDENPPNNVEMVKLDNGCFISWSEQLEGENHFSAQIITENGSFRWRENGALIGNILLMKYALSLDGDGNILVAWSYNNNQTGIRVQKISNQDSEEDYVPFMFENPVEIETQYGINSENIRLINDGHNGCYVLWEMQNDEDLNPCGPQTDIYGIHLDENGESYWGQRDRNGIKLVESVNRIEALDGSLIDRWGEEGVVFAWADYRPGVFDSGRNYSDIYIQRIDDDMVSAPEEYFIPHPSSFILSKPFPNPFNSTTTIEYALPFASEVTFSLYNLSGQRVETLVSGRVQAGVHRVKLDAGDIASGLYFVKLEGVEQSFTQKLMLVK